MSAVVPDATAHRVSGTPAWRVVLGLLLVVPALVAVVVSYVLPSLWTAALAADLVGGDPLRGVLVDGPVDPRPESRVLEATGWSLTMAAVPVLAVVVVAPLLALAAQRSGTGGRWLTRLAVVLPAVSVTAPFALGVSWLVEGRLPVDPPLVSVDVLRYWVAMVPGAVAVGVTLCLAGLGRDPGRSRVGPGLLVGWAVGAAAIAAWAVQDTAHAVLPWSAAPDELTLAQELVREGLFRFDSGTGASAGLAILALVGSLGVAVTVLLVATGARLEVDRRRDPAAGGLGRDGQGTRRAVAGVATALGVVALLAGSVAALWPWLTRLGDTATSIGLPMPEVSVATLLANTWGPPLVSTVVAVVTGTVAGVAIGGLRPLGRWSELLLLPFAPWLLVGLTPFLAAYAGLGPGPPAGVLGLVPPVWVSVPTLVVVALACRGQRSRLRELRAGGASVGAAVRHAVVRPLLPLVGLLGGATWLVLAQDPGWVFVAGDPAVPTAFGIVTGQIPAGAAGGAVAVGLLLPGGVLAGAVIALGVLQLTYLDRLTLRTGPAAS